MCPLGERRAEERLGPPSDGAASVGLRGHLGPVGGQTRRGRSTGTGAPNTLGRARTALATPNSVAVTASTKPKRATVLSGSTTSSASALGPAPAFGLPEVASAGERIEDVQVVDPLADVVAGLAPARVTAWRWFRGPRGRLNAPPKLKAVDVSRQLHRVRIRRQGKTSRGGARLGGRPSGGRRCWAKCPAPRPPGPGRFPHGRGIVPDDGPDFTGHADPAGDNHVPIIVIEGNPLEERRSRLAPGRPVGRSCVQVDDSGKPRGAPLVGLIALSPFVREETRTKRRSPPWTNCVSSATSWAPRSWA
jgi:hypothetical protein